MSEKKEILVDVKQPEKIFSSIKNKCAESGR